MDQSAELLFLLDPELHEAPIWAFVRAVQQMSSGNALPEALGHSTEEPAQLAVSTIDALVDLGVRIGERFGVSSPVYKLVLELGLLIGADRNIGRFRDVSEYTALWAEIKALLLQDWHSKAFGSGEKSNTPTAIDRKQEWTPQESPRHLDQTTELERTDECEKPDGLFDPYSMRWAAKEYEFRKCERRYYSLLTVMWPLFRTRGAMHVDLVIDELVLLGHGRVSRKTIGNYARNLSELLSHRLGLGPGLKLDDLFLRWVG